MPNKSSNAGYWTPLLELIAKEAVGGSMIQFTLNDKTKEVWRKILTDMTIAEANQWQLSTYKERGSAAADISS